MLAGLACFSRGFELRDLPMNFTVNRVTSYFGLMTALTGAGCGSDGIGTIPVSGQIRFDGGPCPAEGTIAFSPIAPQEGVPRRPGTARFQKDGHFTVTSFEEGDGLLPGRYLPILSCWKGEPSNKDPNSYERLNCIPAGYKPNEVVVDPTNKSVHVRIDVPTKK
jgi:hypothetical protein